MDFFKTISMQALISTALVNVKEMEVRLYLLEGFDFASRDMGGFSDPYIVVKCGKKIFSGKDNY